MSQIELDVGVYKLTEEVANPRPDRRSKDWSKLPNFPKGTYIVRRYMPRSIPGERNPLEIYKMGTKDYDAIRDPGNPWRDGGNLKEVAQWDALTCALEKAPVEKWDVYDFLALNRIDVYHCDTILNELVLAGKITFADIQTAYDTYINRPE